MATNKVHRLNYGLTIHLLTGSFGRGQCTVGVAKEPGHLAPWLQEAVGERILHATETNGQFKLMTRHTSFGSLNGSTASYSIG